MSTDSQPPARKILLVEDDLDQGHLVKFLLESGGLYAVTLVQDGVQGAALVQQEAWALVITDLNLPGQDGYSVAKASRRHRPATPILATTSQEGSEPVRRALAGGADDVLLKPLSRDELLSKVETLIAHGPADASVDPDNGTEDGGPNPRLRVLAVSVRPGDAEVGCGGTLLLHRMRGDRVTLLTLTRGDPGKEGVLRGNHAKAAGRAMDVRYFVGNAGSGEVPLAQDLRRISRDALREVRPELIYLPTIHHGVELIRIVHETLVGEAVQAQAIFAYNPGDANASFRPQLFVPISTVLPRKAEALSCYDPAHGDHLSPEFADAWARFWSGRAGGEPAEPLEVLRGAPPEDLADPTLLRLGESSLE